MINSIHATKNNSGEKIIQIKIFPFNSHCKIIVEDNGTGIKKEIMDKIFKAEFSTRKNGEGMGMGLYLVKRIINAYAGHIYVDNLPFRGATFTIII